MSHHYIAISNFDFMSAETKDEAINRLFRKSGTPLIRSEIVHNGGLAFSVYRVDLPMGEVYPIEDLRPAGPAADCYSFEGRFKFITVNGKIEVIQPAPL